MLQTTCFEAPTFAPSFVSESPLGPYLCTFRGKEFQTKQKKMFLQIWLLWSNPVFGQSEWLTHVYYYACRLILICQDNIMTTRCSYATHTLLDPSLGCTWSLLSKLKVSLISFIESVIQLSSTFSTAALYLFLQREEDGQMFS